MRSGGDALQARLADFGCLAYRMIGHRTIGRIHGLSSANTRSGGKATSISVPALGALLMRKVARLASASALVSGRPRPVPPGPGWTGGATCRNGSAGDAVSFLALPVPLSRTRKTPSPKTGSVVATINCPPAPADLGGL